MLQDSTLLNYTLGIDTQLLLQHLWVVAVEEAGVFHELQLMKDFFLLGRGELFLELLRLSEHLLEAAPTPKASEGLYHQCIYI